MSSKHVSILNLLLFVVILLWVFGTCAACSMSRKPAQQQSNNTSSSPPVVQHSIPVSQIDVDQDGTISAQERQLFQVDTTGAISAFVVIIMLVLFASLASAWASNRWSPKETRSAAGKRSEEPAAPRKRTGGAPAARSTKDK